jgi:hypothetical protein
MPGHRGVSSEYAKEGGEEPIKFLRGMDILLEMYDKLWVFK